MTTPLDGFSVARTIADWLDGKQCEDAHRQIDRTEKLWKEHQGDKADNEPRQHAARRSTSHPSDTRSDTKGVGNPFGDVDSLGSILGGSGHPQDAQVAGRGGVCVSEDLEERRFEEGGEGLLSQLHEPPTVINPGTNYNWSRKIWGLTRPVFLNPRAAMFELRVRAGFHCSKHFHRHRANRFIVHSGVIAVTQWDEYNDAHYHLMHAGDIHDVPHGQWHMFSCYEDASASECYYSEGNGTVSLDDIVRDPNCLGGKIPGWH